MNDINIKMPERIYGLLNEFLRLKLNKYFNIQNENVS